ncbi:synaptonemal complex central element protein 3 isoform X1 [Chrysemys picta bellii]|uniref:synaptonemal complex central element protein 3 isoform X1 n=1 Tax=Chrysemys picta bellii TaxID=8478 RepID=UPI0032B21583
MNRGHQFLVSRSRPPVLFSFSSVRGSRHVTRQKARGVGWRQARELAQSCFSGARGEAALMAKSEPRERNYDNMVKMLEDLNRDLEKLLEEMEKLSVQATWMAYDMVVMRTNPDLANSMRRLEDAFLNCKEEMEKNWQEMLKETKGTEQKQE